VHNVCSCSGDPCGCECLQYDVADCPVVVLLLASVFVL